MAQLTAGTAVVDITPPIGVELAGYGPYWGRRSQGIMDPLHARALALDNGDTALVLVGCDLVGLVPPTVARARERITAETGLPGNQVHFCCSHTHSGPAAQFLRAWGEMMPQYLAVLPEYLAGCVSMAWRARQPAQWRFATGQAEGLVANRVEGEAGPVDEQVCIAAVESPRGEPLATLFNVACHGVVNS
jgi:hypothetical protein